MYGASPAHKPGSGGPSAGNVKEDPNAVNNYVKRSDNSIPKKAALISTFPIGEKRCRVRRACFDEENKRLFIVLSDASSEDIHATIQAYKLEDHKFVKIGNVFSAGRIGGVVLLDNGRLAVTVMKKDPKKLSAVQLKAKWEAFKFESDLTQGVKLDTTNIEQPGPNDSWCMANYRDSFYICAPDHKILHKFNSDQNSSERLGELASDQLSNLEWIKFFPDGKHILSMHRDKPYRWADRMGYYAHVRKVTESTVKNVTKIENVDMGVCSIFDEFHVIISRRKPLWETLDFLVIDWRSPGDLKIIDTALGLPRSMIMVGLEQSLVCLEDKKDSKFGLVQLSF